MLSIMLRLTPLGVPSRNNLDSLLVNKIKGTSKQLTTATLMVAVDSCASQSTLQTPQPLPDIPPLVSQQVVSQDETTDLTLDSQKILDSHNSLRSRLGVPPLRWSSRLESRAAEWANFLTTEGNCIPKTRGLISLPGYKNGLGENVQRIEPELFGDGRTEVAEIDENSVVLGWAQQGVDYNYKENKCRVDKTCENYTQVVWRDSQVLGCAAASCPDSSQIWVCNYDPPGNFLGQKPY